MIMVFERCVSTSRGMYALAILNSWGVRSLSIVMRQPPSVVTSCAPASPSLRQDIPATAYSGRFHAGKRDTGN